MVSKAAEILASALEREADAQELGELGNLDVSLEAVRRDVLPCNDIPRPIYKLALRFWRDWAYASRHSWRYPGALVESDWPAIARVIAQHVRIGTLPQDRVIIDNFVRRRRVLRWQDLTKLFERSP